MVSLLHFFGILNINRRLIGTYLILLLGGFRLISNPFLGGRPSFFERSAYDFGVRSSSRIPSDKIAIIAIDDQSIDNIGRWPWPRDVHAQMHDILTEGGAKAVGQTVFFSEPQIDPGLQFIRELKQAFEESSISAVPMYVEELALTIDDSRKLVKNKRDANGQAAVQKIADALDGSPLRNQVTEELQAASEMLRPEHSGVANAIGAAIAQIGGEAERMVSFREIPREEAIRKVGAEAVELAVAAGADRSSVKVADIEETSISYMEEGMTRLRIKAVGDIAALAAGRGGV